MVQLEAGSAFWNSSRPIGSQASGLTGRSRAISGLKHAGEEQRAADQKPQRNARQRRQAEAHRHALQGGQHVPADAHRHWARPDRMDRQTGSAPSPACSAAWESLCYASPPAARASSSTPSPNSGGSRRWVSSRSQRVTARRGAPDLHRRQDNHFARRSCPR